MAGRKAMVFKRYGRAHHLLLERAEDLADVLELDEAHWVATSAPIDTLNCDRTFLSVFDHDATGRIVADEVRLAARWLLATLRDRSGVTAGSTSLQLDAIDTDSEDGRRIHVAAGKILARLGLADSSTVTLGQVRQVKTALEAMPVSEAGVALPEATGDEQVKQFVIDIIATVGGAPHPSGRQGVGQAQLDEFLTQARGYLDWRARGEIPAGRENSDVMPLGSQTSDAYAVFAALRDKVDQYFAQCRAVAFEPRTADLVNPTAADLQKLDVADPQAIEAFMKAAPLAKPGFDRVLLLSEKTNPYYVEALSALRRKVLDPLLGRSKAALSQEEWEQVKARLGPYEQWIGAKTGQAVELLGAEKLTRYLDDRYAQAVTSLIAESHETAIALDSIRLTEKLILYQAYQLKLVNNFVSLPYLYEPASRAMVEVGTLVMDGRQFNLAVKVGDRKQHAAVAKTSEIFVLYVEVSPPGGEKFEVAVPVTSGGQGNLCVGKRGVFRDLAGRQMDARVAELIENPISVREALLSPFRRLARLVTGKLESITTAAEKQFDTAATGVLDTAAPGPSPAQPAKAGTGLLAGGLLMGGGVAFAAVGASVGYIAKTIHTVGLLKMVLAVAAAVLAVMLPVAVLGLVRLRRRDLSAILEGSGWAINARMRLTQRQGRFFTRKPRYPKGAKGVRRVWPWVAVVLIVVLAAIAFGGYRAAGTSKPASTSATRPAASPVADDTP